MSTFNPTNSVVYPCLTGKNRNTQTRSNATPSVEVFSGAANIYTSNNEPANSENPDKPANAAAMTLLSSSPAAVDVHTLNGSANWILFEEETATLVVKTTNIIDVGAIV